MTLPINPPFAPMEALPVLKIPSGDWQYEPKWDGFRCLVFKGGKPVEFAIQKRRITESVFPSLKRALRRPMNFDRRLKKI